MLPFHLFSFATFIIIQRIAARTITHVHTHTHSLYRFSCHRGMLGLSLSFFVLSKKQSNNTPVFPVSFYLPLFFFRLRSVVSWNHAYADTNHKEEIHIYIYHGDLLEKAILATFNLTFVSSFTRNTFSSFFFVSFFFPRFCLFYISCVFIFFFCGVSTAFLITHSAR